MTNEQVIECNKLIAEFDGWSEAAIVRHASGDTTYVRQCNGGADFAIIAQMKYHTSWDWLIPVVEKIHYLKHPTMPGLPHNKNKVVLLPIAISIKSVYTAVTEFLTWYNKQPK